MICKLTFEKKSCDIQNHNEYKIEHLNEMISASQIEEKFENGKVKGMQDDTFYIQSSRHHSSIP